MQGFEAIESSTEGERAMGSVVDWSSEPLEKLVVYITERFHKPLASTIDHLEKLAAEVTRVHGEAHPNLDGIVHGIRLLRGELLPHIANEDTIVFPWILAGSGPSAGAPVRVMLTEHDETQRIMRALRDLATGFVAPTGACASWRALYDALARFDAHLTEHFHLETDVLFPRALMGDAAHGVTVRR